MIRVLHVLSSLDGGGVERMLYNYYTHMDRSIVRFDFVVHDSKIGMLEEEFLELGSNIVHVTRKKDSILKNFYEIKKSIKNDTYNFVIVHQQLTAFPALLAAKLCKVKRIGTHSHNYYAENKILKKIIPRFLINCLSTDFFACSDEAGKWLFGDRLWNKKGKLIYNAIDEEEFSFNEETRKAYREKICLDKDDICLILVGRFHESEQKNHRFAIEIINKIRDTRYKLFFAGNGDTEDEFKSIVKNRGMEDRIHFLGSIKNVSELMCAADILIMPSKFEGLGIVAVEAQVSGLYTLVSDNIPQIAKISDDIDYLPIESPDIWAQKILAFKRKKRKNNFSEEYSIPNQAKKYQNILIGR